MSSGSPPSAPDARQLILIARKSGVSLDWLLLGAGPERREASRAEQALEVDLRVWAANALRTELGQPFAQVIDEALPTGEDLLQEALRAARSRVRARIDARKAALREYRRQYRDFVLSRPDGAWIGGVHKLTATQLAERPIADNEVLDTRDPLDVVTAEDERDRAAIQVPAEHNDYAFGRATRRHEESTEADDLLETEEEHNPLKIAPVVFGNENPAKRRT